MEINDLGLHSEVTQPSFDCAADDKITTLFKSAAFAKETVEYVYDGIKYDIFALSNPQGAPLWGERFPFLHQWKFVITSNNVLPPALSWHLKNLAPREGIKKEEYQSDLFANFRTHPIEKYASLQPAAVCSDGKFQVFDASMKECFKSKEKVNQVFLYQIKGTLYQVRLIRNPQPEALEVKKNYPGYSKEVTTSWPHPYGIMTDKEAPKELLDHIAKVFKEATLPPEQPPSGFFSRIFRYFRSSPQSPEKLIINNGEKPTFINEKGRSYTLPYTYFELFST